MIRARALQAERGGMRRVWLSIVVSGIVVGGWPGVVFGQSASGATGTGVSPQRNFEVVRGRISADSSGSAVAGAVVSVTMGTERVTKVDTSDAEGRWSVGFANGVGDFLVHVAARGFSPRRVRVSRGMAGFPAPRGGAQLGDSVFVVNVALKAEASQRLVAVRIEARRQRPARDDEGRVGGSRIGAADYDVSALRGSIAPDLAGDFEAMAVTTAGVFPMSGGMSALGASPDLNAVTLGGLGVSGLKLPRDIRTSATVSTGANDPSRGWFGGAAIEVQLAAGGQFASRRASVTLDSPALQSTDAAGKALGAEVRGVQASVGAEGMAGGGGLAYNLGAQVTRRAQDGPSLLTADAMALGAAGVNLASARTLLELARARGVPVEADYAGPRLTEEVGFAARLDRPRFDYRTGEPQRSTWGLTVFGTGRRQLGVGVSPTAAPAAGGESSSGTAGLQVLMSRYLGRDDWLLDVRSGLSVSGERRTPESLAPGVSVIIDAPSDGAPGDGGAPLPALQAVMLGGNAALGGRRGSLLWESQAQIRVVPRKHFRHLIIITGDGRFDALRDEPSTNWMGTFGYLSLDDLAVGRPAYFSREFGESSRLSGVWNGFIAAADRWRARSNLRIEYGVRAEGNRFLRSPAANPDLARALGVQTDVVPNTVAVLPRAGFTWTLRSGSGSVAGGPLGYFAFSNASVIRGGVGRFRSLLGSSVVAPAIAQTALPGAQQRLLCVGDAVPVAGPSEWAAWSRGEATPSVCRASAAVGEGNQSDVAPAVFALSHDYQPPESWRANLAWSAAHAGLAWQVEGIMSLNRHQRSIVDANFSGVERFALGDEGRPVFVPATSIVTESGIPVPAASRRAVGFGQVAVQRSDLRSRSAQIALSIRPAQPFVGNMHLSGTYVLGHSRQQFRGFDGAAFGDPSLIEWSRGTADARHQVLVNAGIARQRVSVSLFGRFASGVPFTPVTDGDVNGDGLGGDRAFLFDPSSSSTSASLARDLVQLLAGSSDRVRGCLTSALGSVAARNACEGPWTASMNVRVGYEPPFSRVKNRRALAINITNVLGGLDRLLNGERLRGWGAAAAPDPVLFRVRGFDPASRRFSYDVNPRFGSTWPQATRIRAPFRVSIDASFDFGPPIPQQQLDRLMRPGRTSSGARLSRDELLRRYVRSVYDPFAAVLSLSDSLLLTPGQVERLQTAQKRFQELREEALIPLVTWLAERGSRWNSGEAIRLQEAALDSAWAIGWNESRRTLPAILTSPQISVLGPPVSAFLRSDVPPKGLRIYTP